MTLPSTHRPDEDELQFLELLAQVQPADFFEVLIELMAIATSVKV